MFLRRELIEMHKAAFRCRNFDSPYAQALREGAEENLTPEELRVMYVEAMVESTAEGVLLQACRVEGISW
jgi:hypothetical protein